MTERGNRRRRPLGGAALLALLAALALPSSAAALAPSVTEAWSSQVFVTSAQLSARIDPEGLSTTYRFEYITKAAYDANVNAAKDPFTGTQRVPIASDVSVGSGSSPVQVLQQPFNLKGDTLYVWRVVAKNSSGTTDDPELLFRTQATQGVDTCPNATARNQSDAGSSNLADCRSYELVSPVDKNGGAVALPGDIAGGGVLQAAADGESLTYGSEASFAGGQGAPPASQYVATRNGGGWSTQNITVPIFSGGFDPFEGGAPYRLFSGDLSRAILLNGDRCRGEAGACAVANPPLSGTDAPAGYQNFYRREGGSFTALLGSQNAGFLALEPKAFELSFAGASPDLKYGVLSTCAELTSNATKVPDGEGCDTEERNLYLYSPSGPLTLVNLLPAQSTGTPGAKLAAQSGAVSSDGSRVYFTLEGDLYLRSAGQTKQVDEDAGGEGAFQTASADGTVAFFTKGEHIWRYLSSTDTATDITPSGGVKGVLGASSNGQAAFFQDASAVKRWNNGATSTVAAGAEAALASNWPPTTGASRVSPDGSRLLFTSKAQLTGYDNKDLNTGQADAQVFLWEATGATLSCVSCNPTFGRPVGASSIPGSIPNGTAEGSTNTYKPRVFSTSGKRVFFESQDALAPSDTNDETDVYEWEAQGEGSCNRSGGCISLISSGRSAKGATFIDASSDGEEAFFVTDGSLVDQDPGARDAYVAKTGGGFVTPTPPLDCDGDACQPLPSAPRDPTLTTLLTGPGNPGIRFPGERRKRCPKGKVKRKGKCVKKRGSKAGKAKKGSRRR